MANKAQSNRLDWMDALRGFGAVIVVIYHTSGFFGSFTFLGPQVAVDLFFVLSGFILAQVYEPRFARGLSPTAFMWQRIARLVPIYAFGTSITLAWLLLMKFGRSTEGSFNPVLVSWQNLLLIPSPASAAPDQALLPLNIPGWTLLAELIVNLVFALTWRSSRKMLVITAASLVALVIAGYMHGDLNVGYAWPTAWMGLARVLFGFFMGVFLYRLRDKFPRLQTRVWVILLLFFGSISIPLTHHRWILDLAIITLFYPVLMMAGYQSKPLKALSPVYKFLGYISYPLYSIHYGILMIVDGVARHVPQLHHAAPWSGLVLLAGLMTAAYVVARWDEWLRTGPLPSLPQLRFNRRANFH